MSRHILRLLSGRGSASLQGSRYFHANSAAVFQKSHIADVESVRDRVAAIVGDRAVATSEAVRSQHGQDEGPEKGKSPEIVAFPEDVSQVSEVKVTKIVKKWNSFGVVSRFASCVSQTAYRSSRTELAPGWRTGHPRWKAASAST